MPWSVCELCSPPYRNAAGFEKRFQAILKDCEARADDKQLPQQLRPKGTTGAAQKVRCLQTGANWVILQLSPGMKQDESI